MRTLIELGAFDSPDAVAAAMRAGMEAVVALGPEAGAIRVGAGNYGGKLGRHHFHLHELAPVS